MFQVTDRIRMKSNLQEIDTYGISPRILITHRNTIFTIRRVHEDETGQYALRVYNHCKILSPITGRYKKSKCKFNLAYWNPEMFEKVEGMEDGKRYFIKNIQAAMRRMRPQK